MLFYYISITGSEAIALFIVALHYNRQNDKNLKAFVHHYVEIMNIKYI